MTRIDADKNGFLTWDKWGTTSKIHCPFNAKMQCNMNCPWFEFAEDAEGMHTVKFWCIGGRNLACKNITLYSFYNKDDKK